MDIERVEELEDGEIDDEDEASVNSFDRVYTPLERPTLPPAQPVPVITEPSDHEDASSDSSSDSDGRSRRKPKQKPPINRSNPSLPPKKKKYNIWSSDITEDVLTNNLNRCNVDKGFDRSRDVESYNHSLALKVHEKRESVKDRLGPSNKRNHGGRPVASARRRFRNKSPEPEVDMSGRELLPLVKTTEDSAEDLAQDIANKLLELKEDIILNVVEVLGKAKAIALFEETARIEKNGGLVIMNGTRRRTPGGVYFYLLKSSEGITQEQISQIFREDRRQTAREIKKSKAKKRKEAIDREEYSTLLSKAEAAILKMKEDEAHEGEVEGEEVKNPPPSPATDGRENSSDGEESKSADTELLETVRHAESSQTSSATTLNVTDNMDI